MLKIVADRNIPGIAGLLAGVGEVGLAAGEDISRERLLDATILLVRSVTAVGAPLLDGTAVRFVGTATAGIDHVDTEYLDERGIRFVYAPGSNAPSVVDYVLAALFRMAVDRGRRLRDLSIGIVGFGNVGSRLAARLRHTGAEILVNDPPLEAASPDFAGGFTVLTLPDLISASDFVSLHVPLETRGRFRTVGLVGAKELAGFRSDAILVNTSRGSVVDGAALLGCLESGSVGGAVLDVYENEPRPDPRLVETAEIATPHIAGYALDSKLEGAAAVARGVRSFLRKEDLVLDRHTAEDAQRWLVPPAEPLSPEKWADALIRQMYDIRADSLAFKRVAESAEDLGSSFHRLRREYPIRRTFDRYLLDPRRVSGHSEIAASLGVCLRTDDAIRTRTT